ncbi:MAG: HAMP domain-containing sensor histidine kinase [Bacteroidota bacterium]
MAINLDNLKESNDFLNILLDNINSAIFIVDREYRIQNINKSMKAVFKKPEEKIFGELCGNVLGCSFVVEEKYNCGDTSNCHRCELRHDIIKSFVDQLPEEQGILKRNFYINDTAVLKYFRYTAREITYMGVHMTLVIFDDITEIEEKNMELQKLNEQKNELLGIAAHDLRNPMGVAMSFSELLLHTMHETDMEKNKELLAYIYESSKAAIDLLNDLLDISKIEAGKLNLQPEEDNYTAFVDKVIYVNRIFAQKKNIELKLDVRNEIPSLMFDTARMEQVMYNLVSNAIKFSFPESLITVEISATKTQVMTRVIDQGQGIPEKEFHKVFREFHKTSVKATAGERSTGLGLPIAKKIVEGHGGTIGFESLEGTGSTFWFTLPINNNKL